LVAKVKLEGLNIYRARGKWYVYRRSTGEALIKGFEGDRADLDREMARPDFIEAYNRPRKRLEAAGDLPLEALGGFVNWFTNGDIDRTEEQRKAPDRFAGTEGYPKMAQARGRDEERLPRGIRVAAARVRYQTDRHFTAGPLWPARHMRQQEVAALRGPNDQRAIVDVPASREAREDDSQSLPGDG
jgi:hypothetical protein